MQILKIFLTQSLTQRKKGLQLFCYNPLILLVRPARFERAAYGFEVRRSIQLSYGRIMELSHAQFRVTASGEAMKWGE